MDKLRERFGLSRVVLAGDRGMLTQTQIEHLKEHPGLGWISCLRSGAIRRLMDDGHLQRSLFDEANLAEIHSPEFPGERLMACYNPLLADERTRRRAGTAGGDGEGPEEAGGPSGAANEEADAQGGDRR